jgi:quinol monooxygenase YgiN
MQMAGEIAWVFQGAVNSGSTDEFKTLIQEMVGSFQADEPETLIFECFMSSDGASAHFCERFRDSSAAAFHLGHFRDRFSSRLHDLWHATSVFVYGSPSDEVKSLLAGWGPTYLALTGGFTH